MPSPQARPMTFAAFLERERHQPTRSEFVDGRIVAMTGGTQAHNAIQGNIYYAARSQLRGSACRVFTSDMLVRTARDSGRYPDVTIDCGAFRADAQTASQPVVVFEVLSDTAQREDRTRKLADYNATPSIAHYLLVEPDESRVYVHTRAAHGEFSVVPQEIVGLDGIIDLPSVNLSISMAEVYEGIPLPTPRPQSN